MEIIAHIKTLFPSKFGLPRQSCFAADLPGKIVFEPGFRFREALVGIESYSHLWLIWQFSANISAGWSPTVRPPVLGGNKRVGVFASRSPFRPNGLGLTAVMLDHVDYDTSEGPVIYITGADMMDGTPIIDIKPYLPFADSYPNALNGFSSQDHWPHLQVLIPDDLAGKLNEEYIKLLKQVLSCDPRPAYQDDPDRVYTFAFADFEISFQVADKLLTVVRIKRIKE